MFQERIIQQSSLEKAHEALEVSTIFLIWRNRNDLTFDPGRSEVKVARPFSAACMKELWENTSYQA